MDARDIHAFATSPLEPLDLAAFVTLRTRSDRGLPPIDAALPFDVSHHPDATSHVAEQMITRITTDCKVYATQENASTVAQLNGLFTDQLGGVMAAPQGKAMALAIASIR